MASTWPFTTPTPPSTGTQDAGVLGEPTDGADQLPAQQRHASADADHHEPSGAAIEAAEAVVGRHQQQQHEERQQRGDDSLRTDLGLSGDDLLVQLEVLGDVVGKGAQHVHDDALTTLVRGHERLDDPIRHRVGELVTGLHERGRHRQHRSVDREATPHRAQWLRARPTELGQRTVRA